MARPWAERRLRPDRPRIELVEGRREPDLVGLLGRPLDAGRVRRPRLRERTHGRRRLKAGNRRLLERRERHEAVAAQVRRREHDGALQPRGLGQRDRGSGDGLPVRAQRRRPSQRLRPGRRHRLELAPGRGDRPRLRLRGPDVDAGHRRGPARPLGHRRHVGRPRRPAPPPLRRLRQAHRRGAVDLHAGRQRRRHEHAVRADRCRHRGPAAADRRQRRRPHLRAARAHRREGLGVPPVPARHQRLARRRRHDGLRGAQRGERRQRRHGPRRRDRRDRQRRRDRDARAVAGRGAGGGLLVACVPTTAGCTSSTTRRTSWRSMPAAARSSGRRASGRSASPRRSGRTASCTSPR